MTTTTHTLQHPGQRPMRYGFSMVELLVVISIIALLVAILLPTLGAVRRLVRQMEAGNQGRNIHVAMTTFAADNNSWLPGLSNQGQATPANFTSGGYASSSADTDATELASEYSSNDIDDVEDWWADAIVWTLLNKSLVTPAEVISPADSSKDEWDGGYEDTDLTAFADLRATDGNPAYSYAYLDPRAGDEHPINGGDTGATNRNRIKNWRDSANSQVPILADRIIDVTEDPAVDLLPANYADANDTTEDVGGQVSVHQLSWGSRDNATWEGVVVWNDGRSEFTERIVPATNLSDNFPVKQNQYRTGDDLFFPFSEDEGGTDRNDAVMLYADTDTSSGD